MTFSRKSFLEIETSDSGDASQKQERYYSLIIAPYDMTYDLGGENNDAMGE